MPEKHYITVILPLRLEWEPLYACDCPVKIGDRISVLFSNKKLIGVVSCTDVVPQIGQNQIHDVLDANTGLDPISEKELQFWRFVSDYYMCTVGEVYKAAYPIGRVTSEEMGAKAKERRAVLENKAIELWKQRINRLRTRYQAKEDALRKPHGDAVRSRLEAEKKGILTQIVEAEKKLAGITPLKAFPDSDLSDIVNSLEDFPLNAELQHAVLSKKTVLYKSSNGIKGCLALISEQLKKGYSVFVLANELSQTLSTYNELRRYFGDLSLLFHSRQTRTEQRGISERIRAGRQYVLIGSRSSIFLPHHDLGLILVINEESVFYKQSDSNPRYNARDCAVQLSKIHHCPVVLHSVSPSLESLYNYKSGRYVLVNETGSRALQTLNVIDMASERKKNGIEGVLSNKLVSALNKQPDARIAIIRGFEKEEDFSIDADIFTIPQASTQDFTGYDLIALTSADALFDKGDFRSDEHAFQFLERLCRTCPNVIVQTYQAANQVFSMNSADDLLEERKTFGLPPYTRLVDIRTLRCEPLSPVLASLGFTCFAGDGYVRVSLQRDKSLSSKKRLLLEIINRKKKNGFRDISVDVDPI